MKYFNFFTNFIFVASTNPICVYDLSSERILFIEESDEGTSSENGLHVSIETEKWSANLISELQKMRVGCLENSRRVEYPIKPVFGFKMYSIVFLLNNHHKNIFLPLSKFKSTRNIIIYIKNEISISDFNEIIYLCEENTIPNLEIIIKSSELEEEIASNNFVIRSSKLAKLTLLGCKVEEHTNFFPNENFILTKLATIDIMTIDESNTFNFFPENLSINPFSFSIAVNFNLYYYKKVFISDEFEVFLDVDLSIYACKWSNNIIEDDIEKLNFNSSFIKNKDNGLYKKSPFKYCCNDPRVYNEKQINDVTNKCYCESYYLDNDDIVSLQM